MKVFDFNIHPFSPSVPLDKRLSLELTLDLPGHLREIKLILDQYSNRIDGMNYMIFNTSLWESIEELRSLKRLVNQHFEYFALTILADISSVPTLSLLQSAKSVGIDFIKFHPYIQQIDANAYSQCIAWSVLAQEANMGICIDTSYGTQLMYRFDNLRLATEIASVIKSAPLILLHSGGKRVMDALLLADSNPNIYLETSLTPHFYRHFPSLTSDIRSAYSHLGSKRILYASDSPYQHVDKSIEFVAALLEPTTFTPQDMTNIFWNNSISLLSHEAS